MLPLTTFICCFCIALGISVDDPQTEINHRDLAMTQRPVVQPSEPRKWPRGEMPYKIDKSVYESADRKLLKNILSAMQSITSQTCLTFRRKTGKDNYWATFAVSNSTHSAVIGWQNEEDQVINVAFSVGAGKDAIGIIIHDTLHALSFSHEHNRNDRDRYVDIQFDNIKSGLRFNFLEDRYTGISKTRRYPFPYNYESIMHGPISNPSFSIESSKDSMTPLFNIFAIGDPTKIGQHEGLTPTDILVINDKYECNIRNRQVIPGHD